MKRSAVPIDEALAAVLAMAHLQSRLHAEETREHQFWLAGHRAAVAMAKEFYGHGEVGQKEFLQMLRKSMVLGAELGAERKGAEA